MKVILFVDDETNILNGLRRRLRSLRPQWTTLFADNPQQALAIAEETEIDVVVSDMRMPGMDGAAFLGEMQNRHPHAVRIILSGFAEEEAILRTTGPAHQYLAKPCEDNELVERIESALNLRNILTNARLRELVGGIDALASPPATYTHLTRSLEDPMVSQEKITQIVASDIALTAEVLKLTNSSYFSVGQKITSVSHAVRMLGTETLKALALFIGIFRSSKNPGQNVAKIMQLCRRSQQIGLLASLIAEEESLPRGVCQLLPAIGMLSHTGSLILYVHRAAEMRDVIKRVETEGIPIDEAEKEQFGAGHPEIGAYLLGLWGFQSAFVQTVAFHHRPMDVPHEPMNALSAIYVAQHLAREVAIEHRTGTAPASRIDMDYLAEIGKQDRLEVWRDIARRVEEKYSETTDQGATA